MQYTSGDIQPAEAFEAFDVEAAPVELGASIGAYTPLQMYFLARLQRLDQVKRKLESMSEQDPFMQKLVGRGRIATYRECIDEGVGAEARHLLKI